MLTSDNLISPQPTATALHKTATAITFPVDDVVPATDRLCECSIKTALMGMIGRDIKTYSGSDELVVANIGYHPVIAAAFIAFSEHRPLVLSPDIVWLTIAQGVAQHINLNAETLRYHCVSHQGQLALEIKTDFMVDSSPDFWMLVIHALSHQIKQHVDTEMYDVLVANFSTTGTVERTVSEVVMMDAFKAYFDYVLTCVCGIPTVTLEGTTADWILLKEKVTALKLFGLKWWTKHLLPLCDQFIRASKGDIDLTHWQNLCKLKEAYGITFINGWIAKLIAYVRTRHNGDLNVINPLLVEGNEMEITSRNLPNGLSIVPFTFKNQVTKTTHPMEFIAGFTGITQSPDNLALRPLLGWAVRDAQLLTLLIHKAKSEHDTNPPYCGDLLSHLMHLHFFDSLPGDVHQFYNTTDGAGFYPTDKGYRYRILRVAEIECLKESEETVDEMTGLKIHSETDWFKFCALEDGRFLAISFGGEYNHHTDKYLSPIIAYQGDSLTEEDTKNVIAKSFTELLGYIILCGDLIDVV